MSKNRFIVVGAGGFGREALQAFRSIREPCEPRKSYEFGGFVDDNPDASVPFVSNACVLGGISAMQTNDGYVIGIADPKVKADLDERISARGIANAICIQHPTAWVGEDVQVGPGAIITAHCSITTNIQMGRHVHVNLNCTIGHDTVIEDFATLFPGVHVSGNVNIKRCAGLGTGAVVLPGITIGEGAMVGAGAVVTKDVPDFTTVVGMPARPLRAANSGQARTPK